MTPYGKRAYRDLLRRAEASGWRFGSFLEPAGGADRTIYLRHDVDYSLALAVELAEVNAELAVHATFFVQLRAQFYNLFDPVETARLRRLRSLGHAVALHYVVDDESAPGPDAIRHDFELLRELVPDAAPVFSWHRPTQPLLESESEVPGLVNAYAARFFREIAYLSDSTHHVSVDELQDALTGVTSRELQLLLHPVNWIAGGSSGAEILIRGWLDVLRDHERTLLENRAYVDAFPCGMPSEILSALERDLLAAIGRARDADANGK